MRSPSPKQSSRLTHIRRVSVVETHPESLIDLRVHAPFPELLVFSESFDYEKMDSMEHGHIPAVIILVKALEAWKLSVSKASDQPYILFN